MEEDMLQRLFNLMVQLDGYRYRYRYRVMDVIKLLMLNSE